LIRPSTIFCDQVHAIITHKYYCVVAFDNVSNTSHQGSLHGMMLVEFALVQVLQVGHLV
jgi:hypothetical protein